MILCSLSYTCFQNLGLEFIGLWKPFMCKDCKDAAHYMQGKKRHKKQWLFNINFFRSAHLILVTRYQKSFGGNATFASCCFSPQGLVNQMHALVCV